ncbi:MAG: guanylate kinase [bacterium]|nr:guanylate kinase [bacterium]
MPGKLFIVSAPSGAGKTTLVNAVLGKLKLEYPIDRVITYTTKKARVGEQDGRDYHFISPIEFERRIKQNFFLEWSTAYNAYYGSPRQVLNDIQTGQSYILIIDRMGAEQVIKHTNDVVLVWIYTTNLQDIHQRLMGRATESPEVIQARINQAQKEIIREQKQPLYQYHLCNDDFDQAVHNLEHFFRHELKKLTQKKLSF